MLKNIYPRCGALDGGQPVGEAGEGRGGQLMVRGGGRGAGRHRGRNLDIIFLFPR